MKIKKKLKVSSEEYFNCLTKYLLKDLKKTINKSIKNSDIKPGYKFNKTYHTKTGSYISNQEIVEFDYGRAYQLRFSIPDGFQKITHYIKEIDENTIRVEYEERIESDQIGIKLRQFYKRGKSRRLMSEILHNIELEIKTKM